MYSFKVPEGKKIRVIINSEAKCEGDDQYAIVHALLTPKFNIKGIIAAHNSRQGDSSTMERNYDECHNLEMCEAPFIDENLLYLSMEPVEKYVSIMQLIQE